MKNEQRLPDRIDRKRKRWLSTALLLVLHAPLFVLHSLQAQSVLREGVWLKIGVTQTGVYRLDRDILVRQNPAFANADPRQFRLYGNGGAPLPQPNAVSRPGDLTENAVLVAGEADGRFDAGDALLFFGQSPHTIQYDSTGQRFTHQINPYSDTAFYFLTIGTAPGLRMAERPTGVVTATPTVTTFTDYQFYEPDRLKLPALHSGRDWLADYLTVDTIKTVPFTVPGLVSGRSVRLRASVVAGAINPTEFRLSLNGVGVGTMPMSTISGYQYDIQGLVRTDVFVTRPAAVADNTLRLSVAFAKNGQNSAQGYLDFLSVEGERELRTYDQPVWARRLPAGLVAVQQATATSRIWDVTNPLRPAVQTYALSTTQEARWLASGIQDYFLFTEAQLLSPALVVPVANQNLRGQPVPNLLIVTPQAWQDQAERLAQFRRNHDGLSVLVVTAQQVYNEFGSGQPDPTAIRDAVRYFYQQQPKQLRYLLLFGDATYDYRNVTGLLSASQLANTIPVYESRQSLHPVLSYSSDDYFGFVKAGDGQWTEDHEPNYPNYYSGQTGDQTLDVGVGRLPVKSPQEAQTVVDKLMRYGTDPSLTGDWQTRVMLIADDGDFNQHQKDAEQLAEQIQTNAPAYRPERIFLDNFPQQITTTGEAKIPAVNQLISRAMTDGRLIINYSGHGGTLTLADEQILTLTDILSWRNRRLPLIVTATCQFGRYDDPAEQSGAELALLSRTGGAVGLLTTTRPVYANTNLLLNQAFYGSVFKPIDGQMPRLGDVMRATKNNSLSGSVNRNFALLGDPSMRLAYPQAQVVLTAVNGSEQTPTRSDTLRALQTVELTGEIRQNGQRLTDFTGTTRLTLFDKATTQTTLGQKGNEKMAYQTFANTIFSGQVPVQQGRFLLRFTLPKDIDYAVGPAKLYAYAIRSDSLVDAVGSYEQLLVGGSVQTDSVDVEPPVLRLSVVGGQQTGEVWQVAGPDVLVQVDLTDNRGINVARSGLGHELTAQLGSQPPVILNSEYVANGSDGRQGTVLHTFGGVLPGTYMLRVKAWDINNNSTGGALTLVVSEQPGLVLRAIRISPNPVSDRAVIRVEHNRPGDPLDWTLSVYDLNGHLLSEQIGQCTNCPGTVDAGVWNEQVSVGNVFTNGVYVVRLQMRSAADQTTATGSSRIVLSK